jgi:hypothetical protein
MDSQQEVVAARHDHQCGQALDHPPRNERNSCG